MLWLNHCVVYRTECIVWMFAKVSCFSFHITMHHHTVLSQTLVWFDSKRTLGLKLRRHRFDLCNLVRGAELQLRLLTLVTVERSLPFSSSSKVKRAMPRVPPLLFKHLAVIIPVENNVWKVYLRQFQVGREAHRFQIFKDAWCSYAVNVDYLA